MFYPDESRTEGDKQEFTRVDEVEFSTAEVRFVQFGGNTGGSKSELDLRLLDLTVRAEELRGLAGLQTEPATATTTVPQAPEKGWLAAAVILGLMTAGVFVLVAWLFARRRRRAGAIAPASLADTQARPEATSPTISFGCSGCGGKIKGRAELAGKKVKCPQCGQAVHVPATV